MFIINCKNYVDTEKQISKLSQTIYKNSIKYKISISIAPPLHLTITSLKYNIPVFAQHVDNIDKNNSTGFVVPKSIKNSKINGSLINHSEHRIATKDILELLDIFRKLQIISILCVENIIELKKYLKYQPSFIAIEPKNLIGTGNSITSKKPEIIIKAANILKRHKKTKLLCGAGISSSDDVKMAMKLGAYGILVSSAILKANNWNKKIDEFANAMFNNTRVDFSNVKK